MPGNSPPTELIRIANPPKSGEATAEPTSA